MSDSIQDLSLTAWEAGYSIPELWGFTKPVTRATSAIEGEHLILWGILGIVEYQVDRGAGHRYLRQRLWSGDWSAFGFLAAETDASQPQPVPRFEDAKFGRRNSAVGDGTSTYVNVRVVHARLLQELQGSVPQPREV